MKLKIATACVLAALGSPAFAQPYVGIGLGASHGCAGHGLQGECTGNAPNAKATIGYALLDSDIAIEGIYDHMGTFKADSTFGRTEVKADTWGVAGVWRPPFGDGWSGVLRGGLLAGRSKVSVPTYQPGETLPSGRLSKSQTFVQPYVGVGATYAFTPRVHFEAGVDVTRIKSGGSDALDNIVSVMVGGIFGF